MSVIGLVPARGGSKEIPRKNMRSFLGKPLFLWNTLALLDAEVETYVSTDDEEIRDAAIDAGANVFIRGHRTGRDEATTIEVVQEFVEKQDLENDDILLLSHPTSPYLTKRDAKKICQLWQEIDTNKYNAVITAGITHRYFWDENGCLNADQRRLPRQERKGLYVTNGCANCSSVKKIRTIPAPWHYEPVYFYEQAFSEQLDSEGDWHKLEYEIKKFMEGNYDYSS
jgi:N-acylneuraminate cytidylyltransferase